MIKVTLAKANKIRNYIEDRILPKIETSIAGFNSFQIAGYEAAEAIDAKIVANVSNITKAINDYSSFVATAEQLRNQISRVNQKIVNELMTEIASAKTLHKFYATIQSRVYPLENKVTGASILERIAYEKANQPANTYSRATTVVIAAVDTTMNREVIDKRILDLESNIRSLEEQRNQKNYTLMVELDDEIVAALAPYGLI